MSMYIHIYKLKLRHKITRKVQWLHKKILKFFLKEIQAYFNISSLIGGINADRIANFPKFNIYIQSINRSFFLFQEAIHL